MEFPPGTLYNAANKGQVTSKPGIKSRTLRGRAISKPMGNVGRVIKNSVVKVKNIIKPKSKPMMSRKKRR